MREIETKIQMRMAILDELWNSYVTTGGATMKEIEEEELNIKNLKATLTALSLRRA